MGTCAYCKEDKKITREHVIPSFIYEFQKKLEHKISGWNEMVGKHIPGEHKIKDVCEDCNNITLGRLDDYAKSLLLKSGVMVDNYVNDKLVLNYDFDLLARWLLKVSFNSSRADGAHSHLFDDLIPYMRGKEKTPPRFKIAIIAYLAAAEKWNATEREMHPFSPLSGTADQYNPFFARISYGITQGIGHNDGKFTLRINSFGPLVFYMLFFDKNTLPGHAASSIRSFLKFEPGTVEISPQKKVIELAAGPKSWVDLFAAQIKREKHLQLIQQTAKVQPIRSIGSARKAAQVR